MFHVQIILMGNFLNSSSNSPTVNKMALVDQINATVKDNTVVMYSKYQCPFCVKARKVRIQIIIIYINLLLNYLFLMISIII